MGHQSEIHLVISNIDIIEQTKKRILHNGIILEKDKNNEDEDEEEGIFHYGLWATSRIVRFFVSIFYINIFQNTILRIENLIYMIIFMCLCVDYPNCVNENLSYIMC